MLTIFFLSKNFKPDHNGATALAVVGDDLAVVVPENEGGVEVERSGLDDAGEVYG